MKANEINKKICEALKLTEALEDIDANDLQTCISVLYDLEGLALQEEESEIAQAIKDTRIYADDVRSRIYHGDK